MVKKSLKTFFNSGLLILLTFFSSTFLQAGEAPELQQRLEKTFNSKNKLELFRLFSEKIAVNLSQKYDIFLKDFPNATWSIKHLSKIQNKYQLLEITIKGTKEKDGRIYNLISQQKIAVLMENGKVIKQKAYSDYSILKTGNKMLNVTINIPDTVLTGSIYDIDIILEEPLEESIIAGGLIAINENNSRKNNSKENIDLIPMGSGGIFKSARAPFEPGEQRWAALIAHPEGLISITKKVKIVSSSSELIP